MNLGQVHSLLFPMKPKAKSLLQNIFCGFSRQGFSVALESVLKLALVNHADLELTEIHLPLPPKFWE